MRKPIFRYAYPRGARRDEVLDTLLMARDSGRPRRRVSENLNLLRYGLRARLGRPRGHGVVLAAAIVALVAGFFAAALANRLAWAGAPDLPDAAERIALAAMIAPGLPLGWADWSPDDASQARAPFATVGGELTSRRIDGHVDGTPETGQVATYVAGLKQRLEQSGWRIVEEYSTSPTDIGTGVPQNDSWALTARTDRLILDFEDYHDATYQESWLTLSVYRAEPPWISATTFAAGLPGAILGWLLFGWASRRTEGSVPATALSGCVALLGLLTTAPALLFGVGYLPALTGDYLPSAPFWIALEPDNEFGGFAIPAAVLFASALAIAAIPRRARRAGSAAAS